MLSLCLNMTPRSSALNAVGYRGRDAITYRDGATVIVGDRIGQVPRGCSSIIRTRAQGTEVSLAQADPS
jgi:hypothetical protein